MATADDYSTTRHETARRQANIDRGQLSHRRIEADPDD
jgi:hypothetical protein